VHAKKTVSLLNPELCVCNPLL